MAKGVTSTLLNVADPRGVFLPGGMASSIQNAPSVDLTPRSLDFNGTDRYVSIPITSSIDFDEDMSAFCWIRTTDTAQNQGIFAHSQYVQTQRCWGVETWDSGSHLGVMISEEGGTVAKFWVGTDGINDGLWHHVGFTLVKDPFAFKLYVDGVEQVPNKVTDNAFTTLNQEPDIPQTIGCLLDAGAPALAIAGKIYQPINCNIALDAGQIAELFNGGIGFTTVASLSFSANVSSEYQFNGLDAVDNVTDSSGNENTGELINGTLDNYSTDVPTLYYGLSLATNKSVAAAPSVSTELTSAASVFFFYKFTNASSEQIFASKADYGNNKRSWFIEKYFSDPTRLAVFLSDDGGGAKKVYYTPANQNDSKWHSFGFTWGSSTLLIYKDGIDITATCTKASDTAMASLFNNTDVGVMVGAAFNNSSPALFYNGLIDCFGLYGATLTAPQFLALHTALVNQVNPNTLDSWTDCRLFWRLSLDTDSATVFVDQTENLNTGAGSNLVTADFVRGVW